MLLKFSITHVKKFKYASAQQDILILTRLCKFLSLPQKTLSFTWYLYYAVKEDEYFLEPDDVTLFASILNLASKACETQRSSEKILEFTSKIFSTELDSEISKLYKTAIDKTQVDICEVIDYRFDMIEIYSKLQLFCLNFQLDHLSSKRSWILLNDVISTPLCIYFTIEEIIANVFFIIFVSSELAVDQKPLVNDKFYEKFREKYKTFDVPFECFDFIYNYMLDFYKTVAQSTEVINK